jgi:hypothetical protein
VYVDWRAIMRNKQLGEPFSISQRKIDPHRALILGVLDDLLETMSRLAVDLFGEALASFYYLAEYSSEFDPGESVHCALCRRAVERRLIAVAFVQ